MYYVSSWYFHVRGQHPTEFQVSQDLLCHAKRSWETHQIYVSQDTDHIYRRIVANQLVRCTIDQELKQSAIFNMKYLSLWQFVEIVSWCCDELVCTGKLLQTSQKENQVKALLNANWNPNRFQNHRFGDFQSDHFQSTHICVVEKLLYIMCTMTELDKFVCDPCTLLKFCCIKAGNDPSSRWCNRCSWM